jgi:hypothetical protein
MAGLPKQVKVSADLFAPLFILWNAAESAHCANCVAGKFCHVFPSQVCSIRTVCPAFNTKERVVQSILPGANTLGSVGMLTWQNLTSTALSLVHSIHWRGLSAIGWQESGQWSDWKLVHLDMFVSPSTTGDGEVSTYSNLHRKMRVKRNRKRQLGSKSFFLVIHT